MTELTGVSQAVAILRDAYPRQDFPDRSARLYGTMLADMDDTLVVAAVQRLIRRSTFLPSIAEIRREVMEYVLCLPTPQEAWAMVTRPETEGQLPTVVLASLQALGGRWAIRVSDAPSVMRSQFLRDYEARREAAMTSAVGADPAGLPSPTMAALPASTSITPREKS
jgi:hypothetical protein